MKRLITVILLAAVDGAAGQTGTFNPFGASQMGIQGSDDIRIATTRPTTQPTITLTEDAPSAICSLIEESELLKSKYKKILPDMIESAERDLREIRRGKIRQGVNGVEKRGSRKLYTFPTKEARENAADKRLSELNKLKQDLLNVKEPSGLVFPLAEDFKVGFIGSINQVATVSQVIDAMSMLVEVKHKGQSVDIFVEGFPTDGITDDGLLDLREQAWWIIGTKQYETVLGGTRTVLKMVPCELTKWIEQ